MGVFLPGCNLRCVVCQDRDVAAAWTSPSEGTGEVTGIPILVAGTHNIISVTPRNVVPQDILSALAAELGPRVLWSIPPRLDPQVPASVWTHVVDISAKHPGPWNLGARYLVAGTQDRTNSAATCKGEPLRAIHGQIGELCFNTQRARAPRRDGPAGSPWPGESAARRVMAFWPRCLAGWLQYQGVAVNIME